jgi:hypothetical protein
MMGGMAERSPLTEPCTLAELKAWLESEAYGADVMSMRVASSTHACGSALPCR